VQILLQKSAMSASQARRGHIRISAVDFLNQCCALGDDLESKLLARALKIILQQYLPIGDIGLGYSITSSARRSRAVGTVRPSALAVFEVDCEFKLGWKAAAD
jgi:hypothetical protein